jgi:hypothetical protein
VGLSTEGVKRKSQRGVIRAVQSEELSSSSVSIRTVRRADDAGEETDDGSGAVTSKSMDMPAARQREDDLSFNINLSPRCSPTGATHSL